MKQHFKDLVKGVKKACGVVYDKTSETVDMAKLEVCLLYTSICV